MTRLQDLSDAFKAKMRTLILAGFAVCFASLLPAGFMTGISNIAVGGGLCGLGLILLGVCLGNYRVYLIDRQARTSKPVSAVLRFFALFLYLTPSLVFSLLGARFILRHWYGD